MHTTVECLRVYIRSGVRTHLVYIFFSSFSIARRKGSIVGLTHSSVHLHRVVLNSYCRRLRPTIITTTTITTTIINIKKISSYFVLSIIVLF